MKSMTLGLAFVLCATLAAPGLAAAEQHETALIDMEKALWDAWKNADPELFQKHLAADGMLILGDGSVYDKTQAVEMIGSASCEVAGFELSDFKVRSLGEDATSLVYHASQDAVCEGEKVAPRLVVSSIWVRKDGNWWNAFYQETAVHQRE